MPTVSFGAGGSASSGTFTGPWNVGNSWVGSNAGGYPSGNRNLSGNRVVNIDSVTVNGSRNTGSLSVNNVSGTAQVRINWNTSQQLQFTRYIGNGGSIIRGPGVGGTANWNGTGGLQGNYVWSTVPSTPSSINLSVSGTSIRVQAGTSSDNGGRNISRYRIQMSVNGGSYSSNQDTRDATYSGLTPGNRYRFRVFATNSNGDSQARVSSEILLTSPPSSPASISVPRNGRNVTVSITQSASDGGSTITGYFVEKRSSSDGGNTFGSYGNRQNITSLSFTYENLQPSLTYQFRAQAVNSAGGGPFRESSLVFVPAGGKRFDESLQQFIPTVTAKRFDSNSSQWIDITTAKRFNGTAWEDLS